MSEKICFKLRFKYDKLILINIMIIIKQVNYIYIFNTLKTMYIFINNKI